MPSILIGAALANGLNGLASLHLQAATILCNTHQERLSAAMHTDGNKSRVLAITPTDFRIVQLCNDPSVTQCRPLKQACCEPVLQSTTE